MAVQGVSGSSAQAATQSRPARKKIQDQIIDSMKKPEPAPAEKKTEPEAGTDAVKTSPKEKRMSIQNELLTYGAGGKKAAAAAETTPAEKPAQSAAETVQPKKHVRIQDEILGYGKDKQPVEAEEETPPTTETSA
jgi:hypothetical protein